METIELYQHAQDGFDKALTAVRADQWDAPSACEGWSVRDVVGHVVWGQYQLRAWATGEDYAERAGAPGAAHPAVLAGEDPVATWRAARAVSAAALAPEALSRIATLPGLGEVPVAGLLDLVVTDLVAHTWDIGHPLGHDVRLPSELVDRAFSWSRAHAVRGPAYFGPELEPASGADEQTRMLAFIGRA